MQITKSQLTYGTVFTKRENNSTRYKVLELPEAKGVVTIVKCFNYATSETTKISFVTDAKGYFSIGKIEKPKFSLLVLAGPSGSGKSHLERELVSVYSNRFKKLYQTTTRDRRPDDGDSYLFVSKEFYMNNFKDMLIAKVGLVGSNRWQNLYGTFPDFSETHMNTIIASKEGFEDLLFDLEYTDKFENVEIYMLGLDIISDVKREDRDEAFVLAEREVLKYANYIYKDTSYITTEKAYDVISKW